MPGTFSRYTSTVNAPPKFARKQHQHHHQHQHQRARTSGFIHARVGPVNMDRLMDRFLSFGHPQTTPTCTPAVDLPARQQAPVPYIGGTYPDSSMEDDEHWYHPHQHSEDGHQHHHHAHEHAHEHQHQYQYQSQSQYQHQQQHPSHNGHEHHHHQHQHYLSDTAAATHHHQYDQHDQHHHHQHAHSSHNPYSQTHPASPAPTALVSTPRQVSVPAYETAYGTDSHRPHSNTHNGNNGGQYTQSPYVYVHQPEPQQEQQQQHYAASPSPSSSSYSSASSSSSSLHHYPSSSSSSWASSSSYSHQYPLASSSSSSWASSSSSASSPAPATPSSSSYSSLSSSSFSSPAPQPQLQPQPQPQPEPQTQLGPRRRTRTRKAASKSTPSYHAKAAVKCKAAAKANIFRRVVNSPLDAPTPDTCTNAAKAAADAASSPSSSSSLPLPRRRRRPSPASGPSIPIPERKPPKNAAALAKLFRCPDGTYLHVRHYTDFPIPDDDNANSNANANANSQPKLYVPDSHLHLFWRSALGKFDPPDDTRWMPMARDTGVRRSGKQVWTCTAMVMKAGHPRPRPCGHTRAKSTLIRHINDVHINIRNYRCPWSKCKESFHHRFQLETHVFSMHTFESPYECPTRCGATFKDRAVLSKHHTNIHGCPCTLCPARFGDAVKLAAHWLKEHLGQPVPDSVPLGIPTTSAEFCEDEDEDEEDVDSMDESE